MRKIDELLEKYGESHQNEINKRIHWICVPAIMFSLVGMLMCVPFPNYSILFNLATLVLMFSLGYYLRLSIPLSIGLIFIILTLLLGNFYLKQFVEENWDQLKTKFFPDHHDFSVADAIQLKSEFLKFAKTADQAHILVTTRKDQMRLMNKEIQYHLKELPLYVVDIEVQFLPTTKSKFDELVLNFVSKTSENRDSKHL